jgi:predicted flap endonuclease-1-like 5' DNA nuclease
MGYLAVQVSSLLVVALALGSLAGWWVARWIYHQATAQCRVELSGLRRNYEDGALQNVHLRNRLQQLEKVLHKVSTPPSDTDYGQFLQLRKALEKTRLQYQTLLTQCHQQQKTVQHLQAELQNNQQALAALQAGQAMLGGMEREKAVAAAREPLDLRAGKRDDLTRIQGINQRLACKLQAMGIVTYRQIAEFTSDDVTHIQQLIGADLATPTEGWAHNARALFQQQVQAI